MNIFLGVVMLPFSLHCRSNKPQWDIMNVYECVRLFLIQSQISGKRSHTLQLKPKQFSYMHAATVLCNYTTFPTALYMGYNFSAVSVVSLKFEGEAKQAYSSNFFSIQLHVFVYFSTAYNKRKMQLIYIIYYMSCIFLGFASFAWPGLYFRWVAQLDDLSNLSCHWLQLLV